MSRGASKCLQVLSFLAFSELGAMGAIWGDATLMFGVNVKRSKLV